MFDQQNLSLAEKTIALLEDIMRWRDGIDAALSYAQGSHTFDDVVKKILTGEVHFFSYAECFTIMQVINYPQYRTYHCFLAGGNQAALDAVRDEMLSNAKALNCRFLSISGRHGWVKRLTSRNWKHVYSTMYLEV
jgi:hypothetical protein